MLQLPDVERDYLFLPEGISEAIPVTGSLREGRAEA